MKHNRNARSDSLQKMCTLVSIILVQKYRRTAYKIGRYGQAGLLGGSRLQFCFQMKIVIDLCVNPVER